MQSTEMQYVSIAPACHFHSMWPLFSYFVAIRNYRAPLVLSCKGGQYLTISWPFGPYQRLKLVLHRHVLRGKNTPDPKAMAHIYDRWMDSHSPPRGQWHFEFRKRSTISAPKLATASQRFSLAVSSSLCYAFCPIKKRNWKAPWRCTTVHVSAFWRLFVFHVWARLYRGFCRYHRILLKHHWTLDTVK
jgi:hypothetical protein